MSNHLVMYEEELSQAEMAKVTGGMAGMPGMPGLPGF